LQALPVTSTVSCRSSLPTIRLLPRHPNHFLSCQPSHVTPTDSCHLDRRERSLNPSPNSHQPALTTRSISGRRFLHSNFLLSRFLPLVEMTASHHPHYHPDHALSGRPQFVIPTAICPVDRALPSRPRFVLPATLRPPGRALSSRPRFVISTEGRDLTNQQPDPSNLRLEISPFGRDDKQLPDQHATGCYPVRS
jgi:hypothetical protein